MKLFLNSQRFGLWALFIGFAVLSSSVPAHARGSDDDDHHEFERLIALTAGPAAPAGARGFAELEVGHRGDSRTNRVEVDTFGLAPGVYTVTVFEQSGGNSAVLGTFRAGDDDDDDDDDSSGRNRGPGGSEQSRGSGDDDDDNDEGEGDFGIPSTVNALNLGPIVITDSEGNVVLSGDFSDASAVQRGRFSARAPVTPGEFAPDASGRSELRGKVRKGRSNGQFRLDARGLPANSLVVVNIDGSDVGTVRTDKDGRVRLRRSARDVDVFAISTVSIRDEAGNELARAQF